MLPLQIVLKTLILALIMSRRVGILQNSKDSVWLVLLKNYYVTKPNNSRYVLIRYYLKSAILEKRIKIFKYL